MRTVKVSAVNGWKEVISENSRFRVLFPGEPEERPSGDPSLLIEGYKLSTDRTNWFAQYAEYDEEKTDDEAKLRSAYRGSAEATAKSRGRLLKQSDVILNGRLGTEFVIEEQSAVTYIRGFLVGRRMFTLTVIRQKAASGNSAIPSDVQQFFDSFTFWD